MKLHELNVVAPTVVRGIFNDCQWLDNLTAVVYPHHDSADIVNLLMDSWDEQYRPEDWEKEFDSLDGYDPVNWEVEITTNEWKNWKGEQAYFVNVYEITQGYGGPEEGGWWFTAGRVVETRICQSYSQADGVRDTLLEDFTDEGYRYSVIPQGEDYNVVIELHPGEAFPKERPYYE